MVIEDEVSVGDIYLGAALKELFDTAVSSQPIYKQQLVLLVMLIRILRH